MLDNLRRGAGGFLSKVLMAILALAFVVWGIAGTFNGFGLGRLATVGESEIEVDEFRRNLSNVLDNVAQITRRRPTQDEVRARGFDRRVLEDMINMVAIDNHARELGLALSADKISEIVRNDPAFAGPDGKFNLNQFRNAISQQGLNERTYVAQRRREEVREQLSQSMFETPAISKALIGLVHRFSAERRVVEQFTIDPAKAPKPAEPDEAKLKAVYEQNLRRFMAPEYRGGTILMLTRDAVRKGVTVDPARVATEYERMKSRLEVPERRRIEQVAFPDKAAADAAAKAAAAGRSFIDVAKERGASESDIQLGLLARADMIDPKIADAAFALAKDKVSEPVQGRYGWVLLRVTEIAAGRVRSLEEVQGEIIERLAIDEAAARLNKIHDEVDEMRLDGKPVAEIANRPGVELVTIEATDSSGRAPDGKTVLEHPDASTILSAMFARRPGTDAEATHLSNGGYAWIDLKGVTAERQRSFDEVKDDVNRIAREQLTADAVADYATKLVDRAGKGEPLAKLAAEAGGKLETSPPFNRTGQGATLPQAVVTRAFTVPKGAVVSAPAAEGGSRVVMRVADIQAAPPPTKEESDRIVGVLRDGLRNDLFAAYVGELRKRYGVTINEAVLKRAAGGVEE